MAAEVWQEAVGVYRVLCMEHDPDGALTTDRAYAVRRSRSHNEKWHADAGEPGHAAPLNVKCVSGGC